MAHLIVCLAVSCAFSQQPLLFLAQQTPRRADAEFEKLTAGRKQSRALALNQKHVYEIHVSQRQYFRVLITQPNSNLLIALRHPSGKTLVETYSRPFGITPISFVASASGNYVVELKHVRPQSESVTYTITLDQLRSQKPGDAQNVSAESTAAAGEFLRGSDTAESLLAAIGKYKEALSLWRATGNLREQAITLKNMGELSFRNGNYNKAVKNLKQAAALRAAFSGTEEEAEILNSLGFALLGSGANDEAFAACTEALALFQKLGVRQGEAQAFTNLGEVSYGLSKLEQSIQYYNKALSIWEQLGDLRGQAQTLMDLGISYSLLRDPVKSLEYLERARVLWEKTKDRRGLAFTLTAMGIEYTRTGEWMKASTIYDEAFELFEATGDVLGRARIYNCIGYLKIEAGNSQEALRMYHQALALFTRMGRATAEAGTLLNIGQIHLMRGELPKAKTYFEQTSTLAVRMNDPLMQGYAVFNIGRTDEALRSHSTACNHYLRALTFFQSGGDRLWEARTLNSLGSVYSKMEDNDRALDSFGKALLISRSINTPREIALTLHNIAGMKRRIGDLAAARTHIEEALKLSETLRTKASNQDLRTSYFASVHKQFEFYIELLMTLHKKEPNQGFDLLALEASERSRARSFVETLVESRADIRQGIDAKLLDRERALRQLLSEQADRQRRLRDRVQHRDELRTTDKRIEELTADYQQIEARIKTASNRYATLIQPEPLTASAIRQLVDRNSLLLEYSLGDERSFVWVVSTDSVKSFELPARDAIETTARSLYESTIARNREVKGETLSQRQQRIRRAETQREVDFQTLGKMLLEPVAPLLGNKRLVIVADGVLQYVPFAALTDPSASQVAGLSDLPRTASQSLVARHQVINLPSASVLAIQRRDMANRPKPPFTLAVIADPVFDRKDPRLNYADSNKVSVATSGRADAQFNGTRSKSSVVADSREVLRDGGVTEKGGAVPRLVFSRQEADAIFGLVPNGQALKAVDFAASRATATKSDLSNYRIIHFATHGLLNNEHPELSGILLSMVDEKGNPQNGFLQLHEIYSLTLPSDLVVLSACQTALGKEVKGEGLIGLTRGFMSAGAMRVVASLWRVDDAATAEFMAAFYKEMFSNSASPAAALQVAQLEMSKQKRWQSPYYWAGFVLQGEWR